VAHLHVRKVCGRGAAQCFHGPFAVEVGFGHASSPDGWDRLAEHGSRKLKHRKPVSLSRAVLTLPTSSWQRP
jgi:hypothetical protein